MKRYASMLTLAMASMIALMQFSPPSAGQATTPPKSQPKNVPTVSISFRNDLKVPIIVQGHSVVGGMQRRGQPIAVDIGKTNFDNNVPAGARYITVFDANQPTRPLLLNFPIPVQAGRDLQVLIRMAPNNKGIVITPDTGK